MNKLEVTKKEIKKLIKKNEIAGRLTMSRKHMENNTGVLNIIVENHEIAKRELKKVRKCLRDYNFNVEPIKETYYRGGENDGQLCYVTQTIRFHF